MSLLKEFALFRQLKKKQSTQTQVALNDIDYDTFIENLLKNGSFKEVIMGNRQKLIHGSGVTPSRVQALEQRIVNIEQSGASASINYIPITEPGTHTLKATDLSNGFNIIGVNSLGPVVIRLPDSLSPGTLVTVKDESLNASINNIIVETYRGA